MLLRNYYALLAASRQGYVPVSLRTPVRKMDGTYEYIGMSDDKQSKIQPVWPVASTRPVDVNFEPGVIFGSNNTPATFEDYNITEIDYENLVLNVVVAYSIEDNKYFISKATWTITNNNPLSETSTDITIAEVGCMTYGNTVLKKAIFERTVLDEAVVIPNGGGVGIVEYTIKRQVYPDGGPILQSIT